MPRRPATGNCVLRSRSFARSSPSQCYPLPPALPGPPSLCCMQGPPSHSAIHALTTRSATHSLISIMPAAVCRLQGQPHRPLVVPHHLVFPAPHYPAGSIPTAWPSSFAASAITTREPSQTLPPATEAARFSDLSRKGMLGVRVKVG